MLSLDDDDECEEEIGQKEEEEDVWFFSGDNAEIFCWGLERVETTSLPCHASLLFFKKK
jgi:hypothetical protein